MWNIQTFPELPSTQTLARERFYLGTAKHGDVIIALHQTGGRGRYENRNWYDERGSNLLMSILLTEIPSHLSDKMQFVTALSVLVTIRTLLGENLGNFAGERVQLKWANDILIDRKKVSGVLSEGIWTGSDLKGIILGIGININQDFFPEQITDKAISLRQLLRSSFPLEPARDLLLMTLQHSLAHYLSAAQLMDDLRTELEWMRGLKDFSLTERHGTKRTGLRYDGITDDGALRTIAPDGSLHIYQNATLQFA